MVFTAYGQDRIQRIGMRGTTLPSAIFKNVFDAYNFTIISNLFDSIEPYALSTHNEKCAKKRIIFGEALRIRVKNFKHNLRENHSKRT